MGKVYNNAMKNNVKSWMIASLCFLLVIISLVFFVQSRSKNSTHSITLTDVGFDTPISFQADCTDEEFKRYTSILKNTFQKNNQRFDQYHAYKGVNNIYTLNQEAGIHPVKVDTITLRCIQEAIQINKICPKFDISYGSVLELWHSYREEGIEKNNQGEDGNLPTSDALENAKEHTGINKIHIQGNEISYLDPDLKIDLGGIAKGYTAQIAKQKLNKAGLHNGYINAGGNVVLLGEKSDGKPWQIGIQSPDDTQSLLRIQVDDPDLSIVTSGDYQRYYEVGNQRYSHIIDPDTAYPATECRSVTVLSDESGKADGLSTSLFCLNYEEGYALAKKENIEAVWIFDKDKAPDKKADFTTKNYAIYATPSLRKKLELSN